MVKKAEETAPSSEKYMATLRGNPKGLTIEQMAAQSGISTTTIGRGLNIQTRNKKVIVVGTGPKRRFIMPEFASAHEIQVSEPHVTEGVTPTKRRQSTVIGAAVVKALKKAPNGEMRSTDIVKVTGISSATMSTIMNYNGAAEQLIKMAPSATRTGAWYKLVGSPEAPPASSPAPEAPQAAPAGAEKTSGGRGKYDRTKATMIRHTDDENKFLAELIYEEWLKSPFMGVPSELIKRAMAGLPENRQRPAHFISMLKPVQARMMEMLQSAINKPAIEIPKEVEKRVEVAPDMDVYLDQVVTFEKLEAHYFERRERLERKAFEDRIAALELNLEQLPELIGAMRENSGLMRDVIGHLAGVKARAIAEVHTSLTHEPAHVKPRVMIVGGKHDWVSTIRSRLQGFNVEIVKSSEPNELAFTIPQSCDFVLLNTAYCSHKAQDRAEKHMPERCLLVRCGSTQRIEDVLRSIAVGKTRESDLKEVACWVSHALMVSPGRRPIDRS